MTSEQPVLIKIDPDVAPLLDRYMARRYDDVERLQTALAESDFATLESLGHQLKGSGPAYGFERYGSLGAELEEASGQEDMSAVKRIVTDLIDYTQNIQLVE